MGVAAKGSNARAHYYVENGDAIIVAAYLVPFIIVLVGIFIALWCCVPSKEVEKVITASPRLQANIVAGVSICVLFSIYTFALDMRSWCIEKNDVPSYYTKIPSFVISSLVCAILYFFLPIIVLFVITCFCVYAHCKEKGSFPNERGGETPTPGGGETLTPGGGGTPTPGGGETPTPGGGGTPTPGGGGTPTPGGGGTPTPGRGGTPTPGGGGTPTPGGGGTPTPGGGGTPTPGGGGTPTPGGGGTPTPGGGGTPTPGGGGTPTPGGGGTPTPGGGGTPTPGGGGTPTPGGGGTPTPGGGGAPTQEGGETLTQRGVYKYFALSCVGSAILSLMAHFPSILMAWVTDPFYASRIAIFYGISIGVYFILFHLAYNLSLNIKIVLCKVHNNKVELMSWLLDEQNGEVKLKKVINKVIAKKDGNELKLTYKLSKVICEEGNEVKLRSCVFIFISLIILAIVVSTIIVVIALFVVTVPVNNSIETAADGISSIYSGAVILIGALLAYRIGGHCISNPFSISDALKTAMGNVSFPDTTNRSQTSTGSGTIGQTNSSDVAIQQNPSPSAGNQERSLSESPNPKNIMWEKLTEEGRLTEVMRVIIQQEVKKHKESLLSPA